MGVCLLLVSVHAREKYVYTCVLGLSDLSSFLEAIFSAHTVIYSCFELTDVSACRNISCI